jgi:hypothetical protein
VTLDGGEDNGKRPVSLPYDFENADLDLEVRSLKATKQGFGESHIVYGAFVGILASLINTIW